MLSGRSLCIGVAFALLLSWQPAAAQSHWKELLDLSRTPIAWNTDGAITELQSVEGGNLAPRTPPFMSAEPWSPMPLYSLYWPSYRAPSVGFVYVPAGRLGIALPLWMPGLPY
jgi:hypothetical protein